MILTEAELQKMKKPTQYEGVFTYEAPEGYEFWSENTCYGTTVWGGDCLTNYYYLKEKKNEINTEKDSE